MTSWKQSFLKKQKPNVKALNYKVKFQNSYLIYVYFYNWS